MENTEYGGPLYRGAVLFVTNISRASLLGLAAGVIITAALVVPALIS